MKPKPAISIVFLFLGAVALLGWTFMGSHPRERAEIGAGRTSSVAVAGEKASLRNAPEPEREVLDQPEAVTPIIPAKNVTPRQLEVPVRRPSVEPDEARPRADLETKSEILILVLDQIGLPVVDAEVKIRGMRSTIDPGAWYGYRGEEPVGRTDGHGRVLLQHWTWVHQDGETREVDLYVSHPDFIPFRDDSFGVGPGEHIVELVQGAKVTVTGWLGSTKSVVTDLIIYLGRDSGIKPSEWELDGAGRPFSTRIPAGRHYIRITHESENHGSCSSAIEEFELSQDEQLDLHLQLHQAMPFRGKLSDNVSRPVTDANVWACMHRGGLGPGEPMLYAEFRTEVLVDGTFEIKDMPPGIGRVFVLSRGWASKKMIPDTHEPEANPLYILESSTRDYQHQYIEVPSLVDPFVVQMEPTGTIEITVTTKDGSPLDGAAVLVSPNVHFDGIGSTLVPWRNWKKETDSRGIAVFDDIPPERRVPVIAQHPDFEMSYEDRQNLPRVAVESEEISKVTVVLVPKGGR